MKFSVLVSVYIKENPTNLSLALKSLFNQTCLPNEIVLVKDGPLTRELDDIILFYESSYPQVFRTISLKENVGLGNALNEGLLQVSNEVVARMDTDDICYIDRFEKQLRFLRDNPNVSVVGGVINEFNKVPDDLNQLRKLPLSSKELGRFAKYRNPLSHPSVMFKKSDVLSAGSYVDMPLFEDYYLWIRMLMSGFKIANINEPILHFRIGNDMIGRRSGIQYIRKEIHFLQSIRAIGFIGFKEFYVSLITKIPLRLLPKSILLFIYKKLLR